MSGKTQGKKVVKFLMLGDVVSQRNFTTVMLVVFLVVVFWLAGGRIEAVPKIQGSRDASFGAVEKANTARTNVDTQEPAARKNPRRTTRRGSDGRDSLKETSKRNVRAAPSGATRGRTREVESGSEDNPFADIRERIRRVGKKRDE